MVSTAGCRHAGRKRRCACRRASGGRSASAITITPAVVPRPMSRINPSSSSTLRTVSDPSAILGRARNTAMTTTLLRIGANAAARKRRRAFEHRGREGDDAVEQHLRHEEAEQVGRQLLLGGDVRPVHVQRVQVDDPRRGDDADDGDPRQREHRDGEDRARRVVVARFEVLHEQRDEGRGQHPAEEQLVDDVGRLVRIAVGAGEGRGAERVRDGRDAHEAGDAGERGADGDDRAGPDEGGLGLGGIGARLGEPDVVGAHVFKRAARWASRPGTKGGAPASASGAAGGCPSPTRWRGTRSRPRSGTLPHR